jgi:hypothetical protein
VYAATREEAGERVFHHAQRLARGPGGFGAVLALVSPADDLLRELPLSDEPVVMAGRDGR